MEEQLLITLLILGAAVLLLVGNFLRSDLVGLLIIGALMYTGVLTIPEAFSGISSSVVIIIGCMFVIGEAIVYTGIAQVVGAFIIKHGGTSEIRLLVMIMLAAALVGSFMSSTATAAIFIPITLAVAEKAGLNHRRLLMPLASAALISGMMTLVATTPNIVANSALRSAGLEPLSFFGFTPFGLLVLALAIAFMALIGQNLLAPKGLDAERKKEPSIDDLMAYYQIDQNEYMFRVRSEKCALHNCSIARAKLGLEHHVKLLALQVTRNGRRVIIPAQPEVVMMAGDILLVIANKENAAALARNFNLDLLDLDDYAELRRSFFQVVGVAEVMLKPDSVMIDKSLRETRFQSLYHTLALGIRRKGATITDGVASTPLKFGDVLLVCGAWTEILKLGKNREQYLLLTLPQDSKEYIPAPEKSKMALFILALMVGAMALDFMQPVAAIFGATIVLVLTGCVNRKSIYKVIDWNTVFLLAGILPLALALQQTGLVGKVSEAFILYTDGASPVVVLAALYVVTAALGLVMSNTAVAVLMAPMALDIAVRLHMNPQVCALMVALACSAAFISPLGSPVNMLVQEPGGYKFKDYAKTGIPLFIITAAASIGLAWLLYL